MSFNANFSQAFTLLQTNSQQITQVETPTALTTLYALQHIFFVFFKTAICKSNVKCQRSNVPSATSQEQHVTLSQEYACLLERNVCLHCGVLTVGVNI